MKGLRYSASKLIPIAGGLISDSMRTVISSVGFIKSASGIGGIIFIIYTIIPPICALIMTKLLFSLTSAFAKAVDAKGFSGICEGICNVLNILSALMLSLGAAFIIMLTLFIKTAVTL